MIPHNMTWMEYPSMSQDSSTSFADIISSQHVISRLMHVYVAIFVPLGLLAGIIILGICIQNYKRHVLGKFDMLIFSQTITNICMILLSLTVSVRPAYLKVSYVQCGMLSFFFNLSYFGSQDLLLLLVLSLFLSRHPPRNAWIDKAYQSPLVCVGFVLAGAFCLALLLSALLGIENYHKETDCQLDPLFAWPEFEIIKFTLGFCAPSLVQLLCLILELVKKAHPESHPSRKNSHPLFTVLVIVSTMFVCRLFYNIMILSRTSMKIKRDRGTPQMELTMNIAEIVLFSESCTSLVIILCLHNPYRSSLVNVIMNLTKVCRRREVRNRSLEIQETHIRASENGSH